MEIEGIVFDMDGVLVDSMAYHATSFQRALGEMGVDIDKRDIYMLEGKGAEIAIKNILEDQGLSPSNKIIDELVRSKRNIFDEINKTSVFPGMENVLDKLKEGFKMGLVTGSNRKTVDEFMNRYFEGVFDVVVTEEDTENKKPDPDPFLESLKRLGIDKEGVLVVENAPLGVRSAKEAGLKCWAVATYVEEDCLEEAGADMVFGDHDDLIRSLEDLL